MNMIPRFRPLYTPRHCDSLAKLLNLGWSRELVEEYLGEPDCQGQNGGARYGAERTYLGAIGIPEVRSHNRGAQMVYRQVTHELFGHYVKLEGFSWFVLLEREIAEEQDVAWSLTRSGERLVEIRKIYARWRDLALVQARGISSGPAVLEDF